MLDLVDLTDRVRQHMLDEVDLDLAGGSLYLGTYLSPRGVADYPQLLREAVAHHDEDWLADQLGQQERLKTRTTRRKPKGGITTTGVPPNAGRVLAEGEFNRYYARGLCLAALEAGIPALMVYRARPAKNPRSESAQKLGKLVNASALLNDLRVHPGIETALGVPSGPNSGLSVRFPVSPEVAAGSVLEA